MSRDWRLYLDDRVTCCVKIEQYTQGFDLPTYLNTPVVFMMPYCGTWRSSEKPQKESPIK